jgi:hypothetical protein
MDGNEPILDNRPAVCCDCKKEFDRKDPESVAEIRCIPCQVEKRMRLSKKPDLPFKTRFILKE